jgi:hypothetical protein
MTDHVSGEYGYDELQRSALGFVLETGVWPMFLWWIGQSSPSRETEEFLKSADLTELRKQWCSKSPDPEVRELSGVMAATSTVECDVNSPYPSTPDIRCQECGRMPGMPTAPCKYCA